MTLRYVHWQNGFLGILNGQVLWSFHEPNTVTKSNQKMNDHFTCSIAGQVRNDNGPFKCLIFVTSAAGLHFLRVPAGEYKYSVFAGQVHNQQRDHFTCSIIDPSAAGLQFSIVPAGEYKYSVFGGQVHRQDSFDPKPGHITSSIYHHTHRTDVGSSETGFPPYFDMSMGFFIEPKPAHFISSIQQQDLDHLRDLNRWQGCRS